MSNFPVLDLFFTMMWFFLWILWIMLLFRIVSDIFRDDGLGGLGKAAWMIFVCVLPFLGIVVYLIARGRDMGERELRRLERKEEEFSSYIRNVASRPAPDGGARHSVDELEKLVGLRDHGDITEDDYQRAKAKLLV